MLDDDRIGDLVVQWGQAWEQGRELSVDELCQDDPELKDEVADRIQSAKDMSWLNEPDYEDDDFLSLPDFDTVMKHADETQLPAVTLSIDEFTKAIADSGLMSGEEVEEFQQRSSAKDAQELARLLIREKKLTTYQAQQICEGNTKGMVLGNYVILGKIGEGGMGQVFKARHRRMKRVVALKVLPEHAVDSPTAAERFHREVEAAAKLEHPNIVIAHDADESDGTHFLVMQYVEGQDLATLVQRRGRLSVAKAVDCILQAAKGLEFAHGEGVIHRDIKPANLLIDSKGCVKVLDMGLALLDASNGDGSYAATQAHLTQDGTVMGTVDYMSPEQALETHHADARSDMYSLGCTLFYLLTGKPIYGGGTLMAKMLAHREEEIPMLSAERDDIPEKLTAIFRKMVAKDSDERYPMMTALLEEMDALIAEFGDSWQEDEESDASASVAVESEVDAGRKDTSSSDLDETLVTTPKGEPHDAPAVPAKQPAGNRSRLFAGGMVGLLMAGLLGYWLFGIIFKVETPDGIIQIETNVTDVEIFVDNEKVVYITDPKDKKKIRVEIPKGAETLQVSKEGFEADVKEFRLKTVKGPVRVSFVPVEKARVGGDVDRLAAEWVLGIGGTVTVSLPPHDGKEYLVVTTTNELPDAPFRVTAIEISKAQEVDDSSLHYLDGLDGLRSIRLDYSRITDSGLQRICSHEKLTRLILHGCGDITDSGFQVIGKLTKLGDLSLGETSVGDVGIECLDSLGNLHSLNVSGTSITDSGVVHVGRATNLQFQLYLGYTQVTDAGIEHLKTLKKLQNIHLKQTKVTAQGVAQLQKALPNCKIDYVADPHRAVAEWVLGIGGEVKLVGQTAYISAVENLSDEDFKVNTIRVDATPDFSDDQLAQLSRLCQGIDLFHLGLGGTAITDDGLAHLAGLSIGQIFLGDTEITNTGVGHLKQVRNLRTLMVPGTKVSDDGVREIARIDSLTYLDLSTTPITDTSLEHLQQLPSLQWLNVIGTSISDEGLKHLAVHRSLHSLLATGCDQITDAGLKLIGDLTHLSTLELTHNASFTDAGIVGLADLAKLSKLAISGDISDVGLQSISEQFPNLSYLSLGSAVVTDAGLEHLNKLNKLNTLRLAGMNVNGKGLIHLKSLAQLETLDLPNSEVSDDALIAISDLTNLRDLSLAKTQVSDAGIASIARLAKLDHVDLRNTKVTAQGVKALQKALPKCSIVHEAIPDLIEPDAPPPAKSPFNTEQAKAHQEAWAEHLGVEVETTNSIGMKMSTLR